MKTQRTIDIHELNGNERQVRYSGHYREQYEPIPSEEKDLTSYTELRIGIICDSTKNRACVFRQAIHDRNAPRPSFITYHTEEMDSKITIGDCFSFDKGHVSIDNAGIEHGEPVCIEEFTEKDFSEETEELAKYGRKKQLQIMHHNRAIAPKGGKESAMKSDEKITKEFILYKHTPGSKAGVTNAVDSVTYKLGYANPQAIWKRLPAICGKLRPSAWYKSL